MTAVHCGWVRRCAGAGSALVLSASVAAAAAAGPAADAGVAARDSRRSGQVWEVHLILDDGRRQVLRGVREPSRERRVVRLRVDALASDDRTRRLPIERIEGGHVSPKAIRRNDR